MEQPKSNKNLQSADDAMNRLHNLASEHPDPEKDKIAEKLLEQFKTAQEEGNSDEVTRLIGEIDNLYDGTPKESEKTPDEHHIETSGTSLEQKLNPKEPHESQTEKQEESKQTTATSIDSLSAFLKDHFRPIDEAENKRRREEEERQKREREEQEEKERREEEERERNMKLYSEREKVLRGLMKQVEYTLNCDEIKTHEIDEDLVLKCVKTIIEPYGFKLTPSHEPNLRALFGIHFMAKGKEGDLYCESEYHYYKDSNAEDDGVTVRYTFSFKLQRGKRNSSDLKTVEYGMWVEPRYSWNAFGHKRKNY